MAAIKWLLIAGVLGYLAIIAALFFGQRALMYPIPQTGRSSPEAAGFPQAEEHVVTTSDGERVIVWHVPPREGRPVVIFFHGNGEVLEWRVPRFRALTSDGTGLVALSFRGYAGSSGAPTEAGLLRDADTAYAFAAGRYPSARIAVWGFSLGTGPAVALAAKQRIGKLILEAPYSSTADVAAGRFPFVPVRWLMRDQFHSDQRIADVTAPLLLMHGQRDNVIPIAFGEKLFSLARDPKRMIRFPEGGHENLDDFGAIDAVQAFLATPGP
jgi:fermentation-respiration switch protein FrsA (DUF1100 family)